MNNPLRIVIADDDVQALRYYQLLLPAMGHSVVEAVRSKEALVDCCRQVRADVIIINDGLLDAQSEESASELSAGVDLPLVVVSSCGAGETLHTDDQRICYLVRPFKTADLESAIQCVACEASTIVTEVEG